MRTCRKNILVAAAAMLASATAWAGRGATEAWVANYVSNYVAQAVEPSAQTRRWAENGTNYIEYAGARIAYEEATELALKITGDTAASRAEGVTNGICFAMADADTGIFVRAGWVIGVTTNGPYLVRGIYADGAVEAAGTAHESRAFGVQTWFVDAGTNQFARVSQTLLQPGVARRIIEEARQ